MNFEIIPSAPELRQRKVLIPERRISTQEAKDINREWIVTNGLGGYAAGAVKGIPSRRYHGLLVAALPPPFGRTLMLNHLSERIMLSPDDAVILSQDEWTESHIDETVKAEHLMEFRLVCGLPQWIYRIHDIIIEKKIFMPHQQNTVYISYKVLEAPGPVRLHLSPAFYNRHHEAPVEPNFSQTYTITAEDGRYEILSHQQDLKTRLYLYGPQASFILDSGRFHDVFYPIEKARGYASVDKLWNPGTLSWKLSKGETATLVASTEEWKIMLAMQPEVAEEAELDRRARLMSYAKNPKDKMEAELLLAADQFRVMPVYRSLDQAHAWAQGRQSRSVIAGYHWFTDWGRDTMISLEGLTLCTGQASEAAYIMQTFIRHVHKGLIPNMYPDGAQIGLYHTADATLWFFQALARYLHWTNDRYLLRDFLPTLKKIIDCHVQGTLFGIHVDKKDGLLVQGQDGYQLTWMDAKVGDWVVTPRRGKAVEINALWYNALRLLAQWLKEEEYSGAQDVTSLADQAYESFNSKFWNSDLSCLYDVIDGPKGSIDPAVRPNQLFSISLTYEVLEKKYWQPVFDITKKELLTPVGLRSLSPGHPDYKKQYYGDLRNRDAAYHQGTVWGWLIGPFIDVLLKLNPSDLAGARKTLELFAEHLSHAGIGSISEIFDAESPFIARGCPAQAWSVAEVLRSWQKTSY